MRLRQHYPKRKGDSKTRDLARQQMQLTTDNRIGLAMALSGRGRSSQVCNGR